VLVLIVMLQFVTAPVSAHLTVRSAYRNSVDEGTVDAVETLDDPQKIMNKWFRHEGRKYPNDYGVVFFAGWESYSPEEKVEAIRDAKKVLDRTLKRKRR